MVLQKQLIQLPYEGLQTKIDPKVAPVGTYYQLDNWVMTRYPELKKRDGLQIIGQTTTPTNINASYNYLNEIGVITNKGLYSYSPSIDQYQEKGLTSSPVISSKSIIANTYTQTIPNGYVSTNGQFAAVWEDSRGGVRCSVKDVESDTFLTTDFSLSTTGVKPKVISVGNMFYFFWIEPGDTSLRIRPYDDVQKIFLIEQTISTKVASSFTFDILKCFSNILIVVAETNAVPDVLFAYYWDVTNQEIGSTTNGLPSPTSLNFTNSGAVPPALSLAVDPTNNYFSCTVFNESNQVYTKTFYSYLLPLTNEIQVTTATTDPGWALASCIDGNHNTYIFYSTFNTLHNSFQSKVNANNTSPTIEYNRPFYLQLGVVSSSFFYSGNAYVILGYDSNLQNTYFGVRDDGACFARMFAQLGGGNIKKANCISMISQLPVRQNTYIVPLLKTTKIVSSANSFNSTTSVFTEQIYFTPQTIDNKVLGKYLNIAGGYLKQYDGSNTVFEQGFHLYPEKPVAVQSTGGSIANGTYSYVAVWEWTDNQGQILRSEPSIPVSIVTTGANQTVTLTVRTLPITNKETRFGDTRTPVVLAIYRTLTLGTTYYRVNQLTTEYVYNDPTVETITYVDTKVDIAISSNSLLYTTGGVFQNIALPSTNLMTVGKNRIIVGGIDTEPNRIFYSKEKEEGVGLEFSNELSVIIDSLGGDITALATMDDKILVFKKSLIFYFQASSLLDKVGNGTAPVPILISADTGCNSPQSIVLMGKGIMFESQKGIYLVDRQLNVTYIGQALDRITNSDPNFRITSAVNLPDKNLVYFTTLNDLVLVYDTFFDQWYTHTLPFSPVSSTLLNNSWYTTSTSEAYKAIPGQPYDGNGLSIQSKIRTNWISLAKLEGFARIYTILILGENADLAHRLKVNLYYDFEEFPRQTVSIIPDSLLGDGYGVESPYGGLPVGGIGIPYGMDGVYGAVGSTYGGAPYGGVGTPFGGYFDGTYQFMIKPRMQKCTSIMIEIFDEFPTGVKSESFKFSGLSIVAGIKESWNKNLPYTRRLT
jgi:hypothetical protein